MNTFLEVRRSVTTLAICALAVAVPAQEEAEKPRPPANYVVHEWGTFTSMVGSQGIVLDGLHHEEEHLPKFVHDLTTIAETGQTDAKLPASYVTQKMETPVLYFHADAPLRARVHVAFQKGLMTQFYPLPTEVYPTLDLARVGLVDMRKIRGSSLTWDIDILPRSEPAPREIPAVSADDPWHFARQTSANCVRTRPMAGSPAHPEAEHYLFYRGLGRWQPDVEARMQRGSTVHFANRMKHQIPFCMALELGERGGRFTLGTAIPDAGSHTFELHNTEWMTDREQFSRRVGAAVLRALVQEGLFVDEARAMVATWSRSWFQRDGSRIIYVLPRAIVDEVLPLHLEPTPKELVRVLIGRHEFITPEAQDAVEDALRDTLSRDTAIKQRGEQVLARLDRFLEPHLRNVADNGHSPAAKRSAAARLAAMPR